MQRFISLLAKSKPKSNSISNYLLSSPLRVFTDRGISYSTTSIILSSNSPLTQTNFSLCHKFPNKHPRFSCIFSSGFPISLFKIDTSTQNGDGFLSARCFCSAAEAVISRESMNYDVIIVGAGPAGLSAAIRFKQLCREKNVDLSVCIVEKGAEVGAHILSGNVFEPRALDELLPQWKQEDAPIHVPVSSDKFLLLTENHALSLPNPFNNEGNYVISLSELVRWMGLRAEELGVEIYPGFAASEMLYDEDDKVIGVATNDMGVAKNGVRKGNFQPGVELKGQVTLLAEGCRGSLSENVIRKYNLRYKGQGQHQTYALGIKEVWEISGDKHDPGSVLHTLGWPLDRKTYGGSFLYHMKDRQVAVGLVVALNYQNPFLNPYEEFQKLKHHPVIRDLLEGGTVLQYGARALNEGGYQFFPVEQ